MFDKPMKTSKGTWKTVQLNPYILGILVIPTDSNSVLSLIATSLLLIVSGLTPLVLRAYRSPCPLLAISYLFWDAAWAAWDSLTY